MFPFWLLTSSPTFARVAMNETPCSGFCGEGSNFSQLNYDCLRLVGWLVGGTLIVLCSLAYPEVGRWSGWNVFISRIKSIKYLLLCEENSPVVNMITWQTCACLRIVRSVLMKPGILRHHHHQPHHHRSSEVCKSTPRTVLDMHHFSQVCESMSMVVSKERHPCLPGPRQEDRRSISGCTF